MQKKSSCKRPNNDNFQQIGSCKKVIKISKINITLSVLFHQFCFPVACPGILDHNLTQKVETPIMLLRNIDHSVGLCNNIRFVMMKLGSHVPEAKILTRTNV
ncbi:hypothetical protein ACS0TY_003314 [Phlomoides rotata]